MIVLLETLIVDELFQVFYQLLNKVKIMAGMSEVIDQERDD